MIKRVYAECTPLYQLIKLMNIMKTDPTDTVLCPIVILHQKVIPECI